MVMSVERLIEVIHASPLRFSISICGAGAGVISCLTRVPECSRTLLQANVSYHRGSTQAALDGLPHHIVSAETARMLAQHAFHTSQMIAFGEARQRASSFCKVASSALLAEPIFGIGATSAIKTSRIRKSKDQVHVCVWGSTTGAARRSANGGSSYPDGEVREYHMEMPDRLSRAEQDEQVELMVLHAMARTVELYAAGDGDAISGPSAGAPLYPMPLLRVLLPQQVEKAGANGGEVSLPTAPSARRTSAEVVQLCAVPSESAPLPVCLDPGTEVLYLLDKVLASLSTKEIITSAAAEVCVLWNQHGEVRTGGLVPYVPEWNGEVDRVQQRGGGRGKATAPIDAAAAVLPPEPYRMHVSDPIQLLYSGSFNPLHYGHTELVRAATRVLLRLRSDASSEHGTSPPPVKVTFEIALKAVDKNPVSLDDLERRVCQFLRLGERVAVTAATLFVMKAKLFPGHGLLIGIDTAVRVLDPKHYSSCKDPAEAEAAMVERLKEDIGGRGCYFVVGGRKVNDTVGWQSLSSLRVPEEVRHLFVEIPASEFRVDISSTELRAKKAEATTPTQK